MKIYGIERNIITPTDDGYNYERTLDASLGFWKTETEAEKGCDEAFKRFITDPSINDGYSVVETDLPEKLCLSRNARHWVHYDIDTEEWWSVVETDLH